MGINRSEILSYRAPWASSDAVTASSLDLVFSQGALQYVGALEEAYRAMFSWLKPGGYSSHYISPGGSMVSPFWNGHWAYSDLEWRLVRGRRVILPNREPLSTHLALVEKIGFKILLLKRFSDPGGLNIDALSRRFQVLNADDLQTSGAILILQKQP